MHIAIIWWATVWVYYAMLELVDHSASEKFFASLL